MITSGINSNLTGFAKAPRSIVCTEYFHDGRLLRAWVAIMVSMRFTPIVIDGIPLEVCDALFTKKEISELFGVDKRAVRTILDRMTRDGFIKWTSIRNKYTLVSVIDPMLKSFTITEEDDEAEELRAYRENVNRERMKNMSISPSPAIEEDKNEDAADGEAASQEEGSKKSLLLAVEDCEGFEEDALSTDSNKKEDEEAASTEEQTEKVNFFHENKAPEEKEAAEKKAEGLGIFGNVFISEDEMRSLKKTMPGYYETYIDKLSAYMKNAPDKGYKNHCAVILSWFMRDKAEGRLPKPDIPSENETKDTYMNRREEKYMRNFSQNSVSSLNKSTDCTPDPTASYDLIEAQRRAMAGVPTSTKRRR